MTDKALEAALKAWFSPVYDPAKLSPAVVAHHREKASAAISAYFSALPGEAEVVAWRGDDAGGGRKFTAMSRVSEIWADQGLMVTPLVTLTSLQAMQARAEAAERERDYWQKLHDERTAFLGQCATEKEAAEAKALTASTGWADALNDLEAAEARVKDLEEVFRHADASDWEHLFIMLHDTIRGRFWKAVLTDARTALKGD